MISRNNQDDFCGYGIMIPIAGKNHCMEAKIMERKLAAQLWSTMIGWPQQMVAPTITMAQAHDIFDLIGLII